MWHHKIKKLEQMTKAATEERVPDFLHAQTKVRMSKTSRSKTWPEASSQTSACGLPPLFRTATAAKAVATSSSSASEDEQLSRSVAHGTAARAH